MKIGLGFIVSLVSSTALGLIFTLLDSVSYGRSFLSVKDIKENKEISENISMLIFLSSTVAAQLVYGTVSSIKSGVMAGAIVENCYIYNKIFENCYKECEKMEDRFNRALLNTLVCAMLGTLLFSFLSFLMLRHNLGEFLSYIPKSAITGCLGAIGISQFSIGIKEIANDDKSIFAAFLLIALLLATVAFIIQEKVPNVSFAIPLYSLVVVLLFYLVAVIIGKSSIADLIANNWLPKKTDVFLSPTLITSRFKLGLISPYLIFQNIVNILSLALLSSIHLSINLPTFTFETNIPCDFNAELKTQSIANLFSAFTFFPVYFICSYSIFFNRSGGKTKINSIVLGIATISLFFTGVKIKSYIPCTVLAMFPFFIGICICYSAFRYRKGCSRLDYGLVLLTTLGCLCSEMIWGLFFGIMCCLLAVVKDYLGMINEQDKRNYNSNNDQNLYDQDINNDNLYNQEGLYKANINELNTDNLPEIDALNIESSNVSEEHENDIDKSRNKDINKGNSTIYYSFEDSKETVLPNIENDKEENQLNIENENIDHKEKNMEYSEIIKKKNILKIDYLMFFGTLKKFKKDFERIKNAPEVIIDISGCFSFDWLARDYFIESIEGLINGGVKVEVVGDARNIYLDRLPKGVIRKNTLRDI